MRDERTKLLTFVNTWVDGVPQILAKMEDDRARATRGNEKTEKGELGLGLDEALYIVIPLVPVCDTNRY